MHRIAGQVGGVEKMIADDRYCIDILAEISAVGTALDALAFTILDNHVKHCVAHALAARRRSCRRRKSRELLEAVHRFARGPLGRSYFQGRAPTPGTDREDDFGPGTASASRSTVTRGTARHVRPDWPRVPWFRSGPGPARRCDRGARPSTWPGQGQPLDNRRQGVVTGCSEGRQPGRP